MNAVTNAELAAFNGTEADQHEISEAISRHVAALDADDVQEAAWDCGADILAALKSGDQKKAGFLMQLGLRNLVAQRASISVYGRPGVLTFENVTL